jgi:hypothetical protein
MWLPQSPDTAQFTFGSVKLCLSLSEVDSLLSCFLELNSPSITEYRLWVQKDCYYVKNTTLCFFKFFSNCITFYCNQIGASYWNWLSTFVMLLSVPINHDSLDSTVRTTAVPTLFHLMLMLAVNYNPSSVGLSFEFQYSNIQIQGNHLYIWQIKA